MPIPSANSPSSLVDEIAISSGKGVEALENHGLGPGAVENRRLDENAPLVNAKVEVVSILLRLSSLEGRWSAGCRDM